MSLCWISIHSRDDLRLRIASESVPNIALLFKTTPSFSIDSIKVLQIKGQFGRPWQSVITSCPMTYCSRGPQRIGSEWLIISFDTKTETFTEIATPCRGYFVMGVVGGCIQLYVLHERSGGKFELWKMDGDGEWTKLRRTLFVGHQIEPRYRQYIKDKLLLQNGTFVETIVSLKR
ncbi:hypothetical protein L6452_09651 [Arctium lappa]|uniref:Uncharacterized protein n=1 Tax=Arctium lappa TaxID=4217 RepID=A0ACB9DL24_ARCLA|nr:hypothetical protein L6452_09651 [Arctium lappa]